MSPDQRKAAGAVFGTRLSDLTIWGWLLALATIGLIVGLMIPWGGWLYDVLPGGRFPYPALLLALPVLLLGIGVFVLGAVALNAVGLYVIRKTPDGGPLGPPTEGATE